MPTVIGVVFFCCAAYCFLSKEDSLLGLLIIAASFQAASAINIAERGIQPYYIVALFIIARALVNRALGVRLNKSMPQGTWLLLFGFIGVASAFVLPVVFAGIPVYDPKIGIDDGLLFRPPLHFGLNNVAQAGFLACHIATAYSVLAIGFDSIKARRAFILAFYIVVFVLAAQSLCQFTGIPFPHSLIRNNPGYALQSTDDQVGGTRNPGTFSEPSGAGEFLALYCVSFLAEYLSGKRRVWRVIVSLLGSGLVASSGSMLTLSLCLPALFVRYFPLRFPWFINIGRTKRMLYIMLILAIPLTLALLGSSSYRAALTDVTVSKGESASFIDRTAADLYALQLLPQTHWIGVGLGSNRASSLLTTMLSDIGIAGTLSFAMFYIRLFVKLPGEYAWLKWGAFALLLDKCLSGPDVTTPMLWIPILLAIQFSSDTMTSKRRILSGESRDQGSPSQHAFTSA